MTGAAADHELLRAALAGDGQARRRLVDRLLPTVKSRVLHVLLRHKRREQVEQVVDDLTQQVFLLLFEAGGRRLRAWSPGRGASLATFVGLVAEREVLAIIRRGRRNPWTESPTDHDALVDCAGTEEGHAACLERRDLLNVVLDRALATLDERGLVLFQRVIVDEAPIEAIAAEMGMTVAALYMWKSRFAKTVREIGEQLARESGRMSAAPSLTTLIPDALRTR